MSTLSSQRNQSSQEALYEFTNGIPEDKQLAQEEIFVQKAWVTALHKGAYLSAEEVEKAQACLDEIGSLMSSSQFPWKVEDEDIHMNIERYMTEKVGDLGKKIHMGRSRNDLIATTLRKKVGASLESVKSQVSELVEVFKTKAQENHKVIVPGFTHQQAGQPVRYSHVLLAHAEGFKRDLVRLKQSQDEAMSSMPLGSAAFAGSHLKIDLASLAKELGFSSPPINSYDGVSDRDFILQSLGAFSQIAVHLGRLCEDLIFWSSTPMTLIKLPANWSTGSSIMPNKRNPDIPELIRAKTSKVVASSFEGMSLVKSVATSYGSDLHELKETYLRSLKHLQSSLKVMVPFIQEMGVNEARAKELLDQGHILATEIANHLTANGVPFREAYQKVAALVEVADGLGLQVHQLKAENFQDLVPELDPIFLEGLSYESAVKARSLPGGTA